MPSEPICAALEQAARAICAERCAFMGEPACWEVFDHTGEPLMWPNPDCDEPGCHALAAAAVAAAVAVERAARGGE